METLEIIDKRVDLENTGSASKFPLQGAEGVEISGSQAVLDAFVAEGVDTIFGYPGGAIMPIYDALYDNNDRIKHILVRHEQGGITAAQGYA